MANDSVQLMHEGGAWALRVARSEGLAGAVRGSAQCMADVRAGQQSAHYCLGVETALMLMFKRTPPATLDPATLAWFEGEAMTDRLLTYCYTHLELKGDMQCLAQMGTAKAAVEPLVTARWGAALR